MKKIAITGGSKGIGAAIVNLLKDDYEIVNCSRKCGYDITKKIPFIKGVNILILSAGVWTGEQLFPLYEATKNMALAYAPVIDHLIFILSNAAEKDYGNHDYTTVKSGLLHLSRWIRNRYSLIKVSCISPGTCNTGFWDGAEEDNREKCTPIEPEEIANAVKFAIDCPSIVTEMIILPRGEKDAC